MAACCCANEEDVKIDRRIGLFVSLAAIFVVSLVVGDVIGGKLLDLPVQLGSWSYTFRVTVGMIPFPVTFLLTDLLNEFYGKKAARFVTMVGFFMAVYTLAIILLAARLPISELAHSPDWQGVREDAFNNVLAGGTLILVGSIVAYVMSQFTDIFVFHLLKRQTKNKYLWLRATGSTIVSQLIDTIVINTIVWTGTLKFADLVGVMLSSYVVKLFVAIALTPLIYAGHALVERYMHMRPVELDENGEPIEHTGDPVRAIDASRPDFKTNT